MANLFGSGFTGCGNRAVTMDTALICPAIAPDWRGGIGRGEGGTTVLETSRIIKLLLSIQNGS